MKGYKDALYKLVGQTIEIDIPQMTTTGTNLRKGKYLITAAYPHYVMGERTCENGYIERTCFIVGTLICKGILKKGADNYVG